MALAPGTRIGHYEVSALIGEGGMGQVWQATDTQLNRQVALKILPDAFAADPDRLARFKREAQILASLNHPNIAAIYGIEEAEGTRALVLELVEGPTLADRIRKGPIPLDEALPIAKQIAEALEAAHEAGVIHRDLKPANIKVRDDGTVKVLDFGLAKAMAPGVDETGDTSLSSSPTLTLAATRRGEILGTAAYMSPEQASGRAVDERTDVWAFGCVLYEALSGRKVFEGGSVNETLAEVLKNTPGWDLLPGAVPKSVRNLLTRCLTKDRMWRLQHVGEARIALHHAMNDRSDDERTRVPLTKSGRTPWLVAAAMTAVAAAAWVSPREQVPSSEPLRAVIPVAPAVRLSSPIGGHYKGILAISPDGTRLVFSRGERRRGRSLRSADGWV